MDYTDNTEPAKNYRLWTGISTIASVLKRKCKLNWASLTFFPNMYIILIGPPASKKGTAMKSGIDLLYEVGMEISPDAITKEALIKTIKNTSEVNTYKKNGRIVEVHHCSYTICSPEISVLFGNKDNQIIQYLTDWFDCGKTKEGIWTYETKGSGADVIKGIWVNLIGGTTPEQLAMHPEISPIGLASRLILVNEYSKGKSVFFPELSEEQKKIEKQLIHDLKIISDMAGEFIFTENFKSYYKNWYYNNDKNKNYIDKKLLRYFDRRMVHLLKLCMILSVSRGKEMVLRERDIKRADSILKRTEINMPFAYEPSTTNPLIRMVNVIMKDIAIEKRIHITELYRIYLPEIGSQLGFNTIIEAILGLEDYKKGKDGYIYHIRKGVKKNEKK